METKKQRIIKVTTSEVEIITRHYTYQVAIDENMAESFIEKMDGLCGNEEIYKFISKSDGKQYPTDDNFTSSVSEVELLNQLPLSFEPLK